jgi:hypothetical protein
LLPLVDPRSRASGLRRERERERERERREREKSVEEKP